MSTAKAFDLLEAVCAQATGGRSLRVLSDLEDFERFAPAWESLEARAEVPMQHCIWARAWVEAYANRGWLKVLVAGRKEELTAVVPLIERPGLFPRLELLGERELGEPMDALYSRPDALAALAEAVVKSGLPLVLRRVPADSPFLAALRSAYGGRGCLHIAPADAHPYIALDEGWCEPEQQFNAGRRSDFRRARRRAAERGTVACEVLAPGAGELVPLLEEAYRVEAAGWKGSSGSALAADGERGNFVRRYCAAAARRGILRVCFLRIGGEAAAMQLAVESGGRFWLLKIGHNERYAHCSPGTLLMLHTVSYAAGRGLASFEFLGREEAWTRQWARSSRACVSLRAYPFRQLGLAALTVDAAWGAWSRFRRSLSFAA